MTWNYRIIAHTELTPHEDWMGIHEVYYDDAGAPTSYTVEAIGVISTEGMVGLRWHLDRMLEALDKPILTDADFPFPATGKMPAPIPAADDLPEAD